jgi:hypothetical protein
MIWCHNVDLPMAQGDSSLIEDSMRVDWDLNDFVSNNYYQPFWLSNLNGSSILLGLTSAITPISLSGMHNVDLKIKLGKGALVLDQDDSNPLTLSGVTTSTLIADIHSLTNGMSASNTDEATAVDTSDFGVSFTYAASFSKSEFVNFIGSNIVPSGLIYKSSSSLSDWSLTDQIVLRNHTENFSNTAEAVQSGTLALLAGGVISGTQSIFSTGSTLRVKADHGTEEVFIEGENAVTRETGNNADGATNFQELIINFSSTFNNRQSKRKALRIQERVAKSQGLECSQLSSCSTAKSNLTSVENNFSRSTRKKMANGYFEESSGPRISMGKFGTGIIDSLTGKIDFGSSISGGAALNNPGKYYEKVYNREIKNERSIRPETISKLIETTSESLNLKNFINSNICASSLDCVSPKICRNDSCVLNTNQMNPSSFLNVQNNFQMNIGLPPQSSNLISSSITTPSAICGNGVLEAGEDCDDGDTSDFNACLSTCKYHVEINRNNETSLPNCEIIFDPMFDINGTTNNSVNSFSSLGGYEDEIKNQVNNNNVKVFCFRPGLYYNDAAENLLLNIDDQINDGSVEEPIYLILYHQNGNQIKHPGSDSTFESEKAIFRRLRIEDKKNIIVSGLTFQGQLPNYDQRPDLSSAPSFFTTDLSNSQINPLTGNGDCSSNDPCWINSENYSSSNDDGYDEVFGLPYDNSFQTMSNADGNYKTKFGNSNVMIEGDSSRVIIDRILSERGGGGSGAVKLHGDGENILDSNGKIVLGDNFLQRSVIRNTVKFFDWNGTKRTPHDSHCSTILKSNRSVSNEAYYCHGDAIQGGTELRGRAIIADNEFYQPDDSDPWFYENAVDFKGGNRFHIGEAFDGLLPNSGLLGGEPRVDCSSMGDDYNIYYSHPKLMQNYDFNWQSITNGILLTVSNGFGGSPLNFYESRWNGLDYIFRSDLNNSIFPNYPVQSSGSISNSDFYNPLCLNYMNRLNSNLRPEQNVHYIDNKMWGWKNTSGAAMDFSMPQHHKQYLNFENNIVFDSSLGFTTNLGDSGEWSHFGSTRNISFNRNIIYSSCGTCLATGDAVSTAAVNIKTAQASNIELYFNNIIGSKSRYFDNNYYNAFSINLGYSNRHRGSLQVPRNIDFSCNKLKDSYGVSFSMSVFVPDVDHFVTNNTFFEMKEVVDTSFRDYPYSGSIPISNDLNFRLTNLNQGSQYSKEQLINGNQSLLNEHSSDLTFERYRWTKEGQNIVYTIPNGRLDSRDLNNNCNLNGTGEKNDYGIDNSKKCLKNIIYKCNTNVSPGVHSNVQYVWKKNSVAVSNVWGSQIAGDELRTCYNPDDIITCHVTYNYNGQSITANSIGVSASTLGN